MLSMTKSMIVQILIGVVALSDGAIFGEHAPPDASVNLIGKFSNPGVFYEHFVKPGVPLLMKGVLEEDVDFPAFIKWRDEDYLRDIFGDEDMKVEMTKKENRSMKPEKIKFRNFLDIFRKKSVYLVDSISEKMKDDILVPTTFQCGGFEKSIHDVVMWFSSGDTSSVLHRDVINNLLCMLDGSKKFVLIDKKYKQAVESVGFEQVGSYSLLDVDNVDNKRYKKLLKLPWLKVVAHRGDCVFIPHGWYHQIRSFGRRNMAINYWFSQRWWFDHFACQKTKLNRTDPLSKYPYASPNEILRSRILEPYRNLEVITKENFLEPDVDKKRRSELFDFINLDRDNNLTWEELYVFDIDLAVKEFSDVLAIDFTRNEEYNDGIVNEGEISGKETSYEQEKSNTVTVDLENKQLKDEL